MVKSEPIQDVCFVEVQVGTLWLCSVWGLMRFKYANNEVRGSSCSYAFVSLENNTSVCVWLQH